MSTGNYFDNPSIGSSMLSAFIKGQDYALQDVRPTGFMEAGKICEDLIEEEATGKPIFQDKYFVSDISSFPDTKKPNIKSIHEVLDSDDIEQAVNDAYIYKADGALHGTYKKRHACLDQIKAHDYRRPIPEPTWKIIKLMLENFKLAQFNPPELSWQNNLFDMISRDGTRFQQEHFWKQGDADCRMKSDIEVFWEEDGEKRGLVADLKVTSNFNAFRQNWINSYRWQSKHYLTGFRQYCLENGIRPPDVIWYFVQESTAPYLLHQLALSVDDLDSMTEQYDYYIEKCQKWIDAGKPKKGYTEAQHIDRYLRKI